MHCVVVAENAGSNPVSYLMRNGKYSEYTNAELLNEIQRLKDKKKKALGRLDLKAINEELRIVVHILERRK